MLSEAVWQEASGTGRKSTAPNVFYSIDFKCFYLMQWPCHCWSARCKLGQHHSTANSFHSPNNSNETICVWLNLSINTAIQFRISSLIEKNNRHDREKLWTFLKQVRLKQLENNIPSFGDSIENASSLHLKSEKVWQTVKVLRDVHLNQQAGLEEH